MGQVCGVESYAAARRAGGVFGGFGEFFEGCVDERVGECDGKSSERRVNGNFPVDERGFAWNFFLGIGAGKGVRAMIDIARLPVLV